MQENTIHDEEGVINWYTEIAEMVKDIKTIIITTYVQKSKI
jgi:hypothetical protein